MLETTERLGLSTIAMATRSPHAVRMNTWIPALSTRVFPTLVIDEYIEMWTGTSDCQVRCEAEAQLGGRLLLELCEREGQPVTIDGIVSYFEPGTMVIYTLFETTCPYEPHCVVLTVRPELNGTRIDLLHMALWTQDSYVRVISQWEGALSRLASFFGGLSQD